MQRQIRPRDARVPKARRLRRDMTPAERKLWQVLRGPPFDAAHFRRQATVGPFFADFASHQLRLIIEVDGGQHNNPFGAERDEARTAYLRSQGYSVIRFWNNDVLTNIDGVCEAIKIALQEQNGGPPTPSPSPPQAGEGNSVPRAPVFVSVYGRRKAQLGARILDYT